MINSKTIDEMATRLTGAIPPTFHLIKDDLEKTFGAILQSVLGKLDLVTREEFEVQKLVLAKTRSNLEALEKRVNALEKNQTE